ncbi:MAG: aldehyde dehydrogenase family protein [Planctomycetes bacterium]|nr:aldehyde dehydrogenase family protein [Planctomycetota bacterium]
MKTYPYYLANQPVRANSDLLVINKYSGDVAWSVARADSKAMEAAISAAVNAERPMRTMPSFRRKAILQQLAEQVKTRAEELARVLVVEVGKPIRDSRGEVGRLVDTLQIASEECTRMTGEYMPLDISARSAGREGIWKRVPVGACGFITPFNFPLNLVAHKIAPAIAVGCPFVLKPASATPVSALIFAEMLAETDLPTGAFSVLPCASQVGEMLARDERIKLLSFTGSPEVGWSLKAKAGRKRVLLELGGNAACIIDEQVNAEFAAEKLIPGAFYQSGQSCISVQRILAHASLYEPLKTALVARISKLRSGDPLNEDTFLGPMISEDNARRVESWVNEAIAGRAKLICGGRRNGAFYDATLLESVSRDAKISCVEAFGPIATMQPFADFADALRIANDSDYGLQAGVFTNRLDHAFLAFDELDVGGVIINDVPSFRVDSMPYGGVKGSGLGREGVRFAIEEMSEMRLMVLNRMM